SVLLLGGMTLLFLVGALGVGLFISAALRSQVLTMQVAMVATYLPALLLSGFLFDIASMPAVLRAVTTIVTARYFVTVTRGIFLKGVGVEALWAQGLSMVAFATIGLGLAALAFRKRIARWASGGRVFAACCARSGARASATHAPGAASQPLRSRSWCCPSTRSPRT